MDKPFAAYRGDEPYIFVSYAHEDAEMVYPELILLKDQGFNIWYDEGISPGASWRSELADRISGAAVFLYFITTRSVASSACLKEANYADEHDAQIIAVHLSETELPSGLDLTLSDTQAILKYELNDDEYREKLIGGVAAYVDPPAAAPPVESPSRDNSKLMLAGFGLVILAVFGVGMVLYNRAGPEPATTLEAVPSIAVVSAPSIAVLPFANMSNDPDQEFFSDGLTEDILNGLVNSSDIKVIARTSSFQFKGKNQDVRKIGEMLAVTHILEGSVRKEGNRIRVTAQLVTTADGAHLWSDQYDRQLTDVFEVQDEITAAILGALNLHFTPRHEAPTRNIEAYNALLMGRHHLGLLQLDEAVDAFEQSVALDPEYAAAYGALAFTHRLYVWFGRAALKDKLPLIHRYADKALALDPTVRSALRTRSIERFYVDRDYQRAIDELHQQVASNPSEQGALGSYATVLQTIGKTELNLRIRLHGIELDPLFPLSHRLLGQALSAAGRYAEAEVSYRQTERLGLKAAQALADNALAQRNDAGVREQLGRIWANQQSKKLTGAIFAYSQGDSSSVESLLAEIDGYLRDRPFSRAIAMILRGNIDDALDQFEQLMDASDYSTMRDIRGSPLWWGLFPEYFEHPRYHAMLRKHGLDDESIAKLKIPPLPF